MTPSGSELALGPERALGPELGPGQALGPELEPEWEGRAQILTPLRPNPPH
tara:strand:+ start:145 stop:297 length:153 start_codon:yes stop_codon:yes gene_type:complete